MAERETRHGNHEKPFDHDAVLAEEVKGALLRGTESAGIDVQVDVVEGTVRLSGVVDVLSHKTAAEEIARKIPGVRRIDNSIAVANEETHGDKDLLEAVTRKLTRSEATRNVGARVHKGVVTLVGHAATYEDVRTATGTVEGMPGVKEVRVARVKVGEGRDEDDADVSRAAERLLDVMGFDHRLFEVYCDAGVLFVKGFVPTREDRSRVKTELHKIPGVGKLEALLITDDQTAGEIH